MIFSLFYIISFCILVILCMLYPKSQNKRNIYMELFTAILTVMCYAVIVAQIMSFVKISVSLKNMGIVYVLSSVAILVLLMKKKCIQHFYIKKMQVVIAALLSIVFLLIELKTFSYELRASFVNVMDSAEHFRLALRVANEQCLGEMPFAAFHNGMMINIFKPLLPVYKYYKAFILGDTLHYYLEMLFFYGLIEEFCKRKSSQYLAPVITLLYWMGYPLYSYIIGNYVYWGWGAVLCGYVAYMTKEFRQEEKKWIYLCNILIGGIAISLCYMLFVPVAFLAVCVCLIFYIREKKIVIGTKIYGALIVAGLIVLSVGGVVYYTYFYKRGFTIFDALNVGGGIYSNFWSNFSLIIPIVLLFVVQCLKQKKSDTYMIFLLCCMSFTTLLFFLVMTGNAAPYYYYKTYYLLWFLWWLVAAKGIAEIEVTKESNKFVKAYFCFLFCCYFMSFADMEERLDERVPGIIQRNGTVGTDLYSYNVSYLKQDYDDFKYSTDKMDLNLYVMENLTETEKCVPFAGWWDCRGESSWYSVITGQGNILTNQMLKCEDESEWKKLLEEDERFQYFVCLKTSELYKENEDYFNAFEWIYENEEGFVAKVR